MVSMIERTLAICAMRDAGATYREIGLEFGISRSRVELIVLRARSYRSQLQRTLGLSTRAYNVLNHAGLLTDGPSRTVLMDRIRCRGVDSFACEYNCGAVTLNELGSYIRTGEG